MQGSESGQSFGWETLKYFEQGLGEIKTGLLGKNLINRTNW